ncbi:protocadherin Fat 4-like [Haliotis cracherodii]|uniref:protocadherin Fat 4-like n=1 Tax=Haliotis cracherodii TaxID=6455 RepID=UPI0039EC20D4
MDLYVSLCLCLLSSVCLGQVQIQNPTGSATLNQLQPTDRCVYQLNVTPDPHTCSQNITTFAMFAVQQRTGDPDYCVYYLIANGPLTLPSYTVQFSCLDSSNNIDHSSVQIDIIPDSPPVFTEGAAISKAADALTTKVGNTLFQALVTDQNGDALVFSLEPTFTEFEIDPPTGNVNAKINFDTLNTSPYTFKIKVTDGQTVVEQQVTLNLNNLNTAPNITNLPTTLSHPEDVAPGVALYTCTHDEPSTVAITLDVNPVTERATFDLNTATCTISVAAGQKLDFERTNSMSMTLTLNDGVFSSTFTFQLDVLDRNDPPAFTSPTYTMDIFEGPLPVTPAIQPAFTVTDEDAAETHTFSMGTGTYDSYFTINPGTGALQNIKEIDFDAGLTQVTVTVIATDKGGDTATTTLNVNVADYNDNDPEFATANTNLYISPKTPVGTIGQVAGTDKDTGVNAALTYTLQADSSGGKFLVQPDGSVYLQTVVTEAQRNDIYTLTVRATDGGTPSRNADTTVTVQFNIPPVITNLPNAAFLSEDTTVKTEVSKIEVTETDTFVCEADKVLPVTTNTAFVVEKKTGGPDWFVFYTGLQALSFATTPSFTVDVICTDSHDGKSTKSTLTVNIRQNTPPVLNCVPNLIGVDASVANIGDTVHTMVATDDDTLTFQMAVQPNPGTFTILNTGVVQCQKLMIRETISQYIGVVTAADPYNTVTCTVTFTMTNTNEAPVFEDLPRAVEVAEDLNAGGVIAQVTIGDAQQCTSLSFTWDVDPASERLIFNAALVNKVVTLTVANGQKLDREKVEKYTFSFRANDGCLPSQLYPLYVDVTDVNEKPEFLNGQNYIAYFDEVNSPGTNLNCGGIDADIGDVHTLVLEGADANKFTIVDTAQCILGQALELDRDNNGPAQINLIMKLIDKTGLSAEATVTVFVREVNDNDPICDLPAYTFGNIFNGDTIGRTLGKITASDLDQSVNGQVTFSFASGSSGSGVLDIASDGTVKLVGDPEGKLSPGALVDLTVQATDGGTPSRSSTCKVNLQYVYTTTPPTPPTMPPVTGATGATGGSGGTGGAGGTGTATTLSPVDAALQNPVILGLIAALAALLLLGIIGALLLCCKCQACQGSGGKGSNNYDMKRDHMSSRGRWSPKSNRVTTVSEVTPAMHDGPTTLKYL